jgi:polyribonucleotide nucleotidyltransferase
MIYTKEVEIGGKILSIETGRYARQAAGSVMVRYGDTMVLVATVASPKAMEGIDFSRFRLNTVKNRLLPVNSPVVSLKEKANQPTRKCLLQG